MLARIVNRSAPTTRETVMLRIPTATSGQAHPVVAPTASLHGSMASGTSTGRSSSTKSSRGITCTAAKPHNHGSAASSAAVQTAFTRPSLCSMFATLCSAGIPASPDTACGIRLTSRLSLWSSQWQAARVGKFSGTPWPKVALLLRSSPVRQLALLRSVGNREAAAVCVQHIHVIGCFAGM